MDYLAFRYKADCFRFSHILDEILNILNLHVSRENEVNLGLGLRKIFGSHVLVEALHQRVLKSKNKLVVVNGIRMDEFDIIETWPDVSIIYITAPIEERFSRYVKRHEKTDDGLMDFAQFKEQDSGPTELVIPELGKKADFRIDNIGTKEDLYKKVDEIINKLK